MKPMKFQQITANRITDLFLSGKQHKLLLSDEVGLGKTIVAKTVIENLKIYYKNTNKPFRVIYICSNINILNQNCRKLISSEDTCVDIAESRLTMQHFHIYKRQLSEKQNDLHLYPITPGTSLSITNGSGEKRERALIYNIISNHPLFYDIKNSENLDKAFQIKKKIDSWEKYKKHFQANNNYYKTINSLLDKKIAETENDRNILQILHDTILKPELINYINNNSTVFNTTNDFHTIRTCINKIRIHLAEISLEMLQPDLVIMDEFQRYKDLLEDKAVVSEKALISQKYLSNSNTNVLLLSATPYKPFQTLDDIAAGEENHKKEFYRVFDYLLDKEINFHDVWEDFSKKLHDLKTGVPIENVIISKEKAEKVLRKCMCRTERRNDIIFNTTSFINRNISKEDIISFKELQLLTGKTIGGNFFIEYTKSSPYLMSFMNYKIKKDIEDRLGNKRAIPEITNSSTMFLDLEKINQYKKISSNNFRLENLKQEVFGDDESHPELLLWIPPSKPYYTSNSIFEKNKGYTKFLIFSCWEMVPRMISCLISYEAERKITENLKNQKSYFAAERDDGKRAKKDTTLRLRKEMEQLLCYPCEQLADLYNPKEWIGKDLEEIKKYLYPIIQHKIEIVQKERNLPFITKNSKHIFELLKVINGEKKTKLKGISCTKKNISELVEFYTNIIIGSPACCFTRIIKENNFQKDYPKQLAKNFVGLFNKPTSEAIIDKLYSNNLTYVENVMDYCVKGNLQAVLDEYTYILNSDRNNYIKDINNSFIITSTLAVDSKESFINNYPSNKQKKLRTHFAIGYFDTKTSDTTVQRTSNIRNAFNSPFWPFVLTTTSIGQEGLDFHQYSRKIVHWNLPSNPIDFEQREGRINRFLCHAIRQNIAESKLAECDYNNDKPVWDTLMSNAIRLKQKETDLIPYWCLPNDFNYTKKIERIVELYPFSQDIEKYETLKSILLYYRLTMGQPNQQELVESLAELKLSKEELQKLNINLNPSEY